MVGGLDLCESLGEALLDLLVRREALALWHREALVERWREEAGQDEEVLPGDRQRVDDTGAPVAPAKAVPRCRLFTSPL